MDLEDELEYGNIRDKEHSNVDKRNEEKWKKCFRIIFYVKFEVLHY